MFGSKLKSPIGFKNVVKLVSQSGAPEEVCSYVSCGHANSHVRDLLQVKSKYLNEVTDVEDKLKLAMDYKMHSIAISVRMCVIATVCVSV